MNWLLIIVLVEGVLLIIVGAAWWYSATKDHTTYWNMETQLTTAQGALEGSRVTVKARDLEIERQASHIKMLVAALKEQAKEQTALQAEVERLNKPDLATLPLQEAVKPVEPPPGVSPEYLNTLEATFPPKHSTRKKKGEQP